ncbi:uncharacterized protein LOC116180091 [Photinus pyralis]|uniref:uncharacterized protein LOC116180091 n=1 Tax=Photinus pyralis TaxID=7054 RepID=UPI00126723E2|nr:uncharacterized protein LOC116180091 [Photinus pyralis]
MTVVEFLNGRDGVSSVLSGQVRAESVMQLIQVLFLAGLSFALEETERSIYLQPRHFNPHPYEVSGYETNGNRGPVLFPTTPPDPDDPSGNSNNLPIDDSPYTAVVRKHQREQAERFLDEVSCKISRE